jgi:ABC-type spermidine/putrescine transport system permease subunit II
MRRAYLLIVVPAAVVGVFYLAIFHSLGMPIGLAPFLGAAGAFIAAVFFVRRYQQRKLRRPGR